MDWFSGTSPLIIGHRGASAYAPENTLAACELARAQGADGIEFDVQLTADGWPVVIHDSHLDRTTSGSGKVSEIRLADLQALDAGNGQVVPTLDVLFEQLGKTILYNVEIKEFSWRETGLEACVAARIQSHDLAAHTIVSSFSPWAVKRARHYLSGHTAVALLRAPGWTRYSYWFVDGDADHPHYSLVNERYMGWARARGFRVHVWTVDDPSEARRLANLGVHAIITNKPDLVRDTLSGK